MAFIERLGRQRGGNDEAEDDSVSIAISQSVLAESFVSSPQPSISLNQVGGDDRGEKARLRPSPPLFIFLSFVCFAY